MRRLHGRGNRLPWRIIEAEAVLVTDPDRMQARDGWWPRKSARRKVANSYNFAHGYQLSL
jgi:hypothetical protein